MPAGYDILTSSLFLHHLETPQAIDLLRRMGRTAGKRVLINRSGSLTPAAIWLAWIGTRVLSPCSPIVHVDGPSSPSVPRLLFLKRGNWRNRRGYAEGDGRLAAWPCRFLLEWKRLQQP